MDVGQRQGRAHQMRSARDDSQHPDPVRPAQAGCDQRPCI